jgi:YYY domain-containing protein
MEISLVVLWLAVYLLLGFAALPFAAWLLPNLDHGAFAIPLALAVLAVVGHLVGYLAFGWPAVIAGLAVLAGLSVFGAERTEVEPDFRRAGEHALVFTAGFLLVVVIRGFDPSAAPIPIAIGEKFLDFGLLSSLDRTTSLPPEDMWFAGEAIRYYYGGHLLSSLLGTLTGTSPAFTYNLALAGFYATLVSAAYGLASSLVEPRQGSRRLAGVLGAFFVGIAANLEPFLQVLAWQLPDGLARGLVTALGYDAEMAAWEPADFHYFDASRVVPVEPGNPDTYEAATEFPLFAWRNGDLHAHMMSQPFMLLAAAMLLAYWRAPTRHRRILLCGALPPLAGYIAFVNLWSFPTVLGLTVLGIVFAPGDPADMLPRTLRGRGYFEERANPVIEEVRRVAFGLGGAVVALVGGVLWTLPFWTTAVLGGQQSRSIEYWNLWTPFGPLFVVFGASLLAFVVYFARQFATDDIRPSVLVLGGMAVVGVTAVLGAAPFGVTLTLVAGGWYLLGTADGDELSGTVGYETMLVVAGAGIVLLVELVTIEGERFNVIFKPYAHVWLFWAIATAAILPRLAAGVPSVPGISRQRLHRTGTVLTAILLVMTVPYAGFMLHSHVSNGTPTSDEFGPTLDATAYLDVHYQNEAPAIRWLDSQPGQPTILTSAPTGGYTWDSRDGKGGAAPASLTGIPTVVGWGHEAQYRGEDVYLNRVRDVHAMYGGEPEVQRKLLAKYDVKYIYVGPAEKRSDYFGLTVQKLDAVSRTKAWPAVTIYEVDQEQLAAELSAGNGTD